jgi:multicomponent Na+:H+ antiporter subunit E
VSGFLANLLLALAWVALMADFTPLNFLAGFVLGYVILVFAQRVLGRSGYVSRLPLALRFAGFYVRELVLATIRIAADVMTPGFGMRPAVVAIPLDARTDAEITLLAMLIGITPGSITLDVSDDRTTMYVHVMFADDPAQVRRDIKDGLERRVLELLR